SHTGSALPGEGLPDGCRQRQVCVLGGGGELVQIDLCPFLEVSVPRDTDHLAAATREMLLQTFQVDTALAVGTHHRQHDHGPSNQPTVPMGFQPVEGGTGAACPV